MPTSRRLSGSRAADALVVDAVVLGAGHRLGNEANDDAVADRVAVRLRRAGNARDSSTEGQLDRRAGAAAAADRHRALEHPSVAGEVPAHREGPTRQPLTPGEAPVASDRRRQVRRAFPVKAHELAASHVRRTCRLQPERRVGCELATVVGQRDINREVVPHALFLKVAAGDKVTPLTGWAANASATPNHSTPDRTSPTRRTTTPIVLPRWIPCQLPRACDDQHAAHRLRAPVARRITARVRPR
jgi:hypothetical protein